MRGMDMLDGLGLVPWIGWLGIVAIREGVGSAQLVYFGGMGVVCAACIRLGGVGLIAWIGLLGIVAFTGGAGINCVDRVAGDRLIYGRAWDWRCGLGRLSCVQFMANSSSAYIEAKQKIDNLKQY